MGQFFLALPLYCFNKYSVSTVPDAVDLMRKRRLVFALKELFKAELASSSVMKEVKSDVSCLIEKRDVFCWTTKYPINAVCFHINQSII